MDYKVITAKQLDRFTEKCNIMLKNGWTPYASVSIERSWYSDQSGEYLISQAFIQTNQNKIKEYKVVFGKDIDKDVSLLLFKGWKLNGNLVVILDRNNPLFCQVCIREEQSPELNLLDMTK